MNAKRLIDRIAIFDDFEGDPSDPEALYQYFQDTGKVYNALAVASDKPKWGSQFLAADEHLRIVQFLALAQAAASFLKHTTNFDPSNMDTLELASALHDSARTHAGSRYKRMATGRSNKADSKAVADLFKDAHLELLKSHTGKRPPGRGPLLAKAKEIARRRQLGEQAKQLLTEHHAKRYLKENSIKD